MVIKERATAERQGEGGREAEREGERKTDGKRQVTWDVTVSASGKPKEPCISTDT